MPPTSAPSADVAERRRAWLAVAWAVGALLVARVVYLVWFCPYDLVEDEAFYWLWAQHPAWSYQTKGPGIAWAIWLATKTLGDSAWAVRMVAAVSAAATAIGAAGMAIDGARALRRDAVQIDLRAAGLFAVGLVSLAPVFQAVAFISTIDGPFIACWALAGWAGLRALLHASRGAWVWLGVALGVGFLFKYTILLLLPGLILFAWLGRKELVLAAGWRRWALIGAGVFSLSLLPVLIWNAQHDWTTVAHLFGHLRSGGPDAAASGGASAKPAWHYNPAWTGELVGAQVGMLGATVLVLIAGVAWAVRSACGTARRRVGMYLLWTGLPLMVFYLAVSFVARPQVNWPIAAHTGWLALGGAWLASGLAGGTLSGARAWLWRIALGLGVILGAGMLRLDFVRAGLERVSPSLGAWIPLGRVMNAARFAASVQSVRERLTAAGEPPFVLASSYGRAATLSFYLPDRPVVHCASSQLGGRVVQQDFWPDTDLGDPRLLGRTAVVIGPSWYQEQWAGVFDTLETLGPLPGEPKKENSAWIGRGFKGFARRTSPEGAR